MGYEDISGTRTVLCDYVGGAIGAVSTVQLVQTQTPMWKPFTITGISVGAGTTPPAGSVMRMRVWVNGVRKGLAVVTLTGGVGAYVSSANGLTFTGPANSMVALAVASVGAVTPGLGARYMIRYHHGMSA